MHHNPTVFIWLLTLLAILALSTTLAAVSRAEVVQAAALHAQEPPATQDWSGSRFRCIICHNQHTHTTTMRHPLRPNCGTCHSGSGGKIGCPSCHSMHQVEGHTTYPTCATCHEQTLAPSDQVQATASGFLAYLFEKPGFFLIDDRTSQ